MRHRSILLSALICGFLAVATVSAGEATRTLRIELSDPTSAFAVENLAGRMRVVSGSGSAVVAVATVHAESEELADSVRFEEVSGKDGVPTLRVRYPLEEYGRIRYSDTGRGNGFLGLFGGSSNTSTRYDDYQVKVSSKSGVGIYADVEVQVPGQEIEAKFRNVVGRLDAEGIHGTVSFDTASGNIGLEGLSGSIRADTGSGDVTAMNCGGSLRCDTGSGDCEIQDFDGDAINADVGSGDIIVRSGSVRSIDIDTGSGDIIIEDVDLEEFNSDTGSGDIVLRTDSPRLTRIDADTGSGDVTLRLGDSASFIAHADQGSGDLVCRYSDADAIVKRREVIGYRRGDERIRIDVDTGSGDLVIEPGRNQARN